MNMDQLTRVKPETIAMVFGVVKNGTFLLGERKKVLYREITKHITVYYNKVTYERGIYIFNTKIQLTPEEWNDVLVIQEEHHIDTLKKVWDKYDPFLLEEVKTVVNHLSDSNIEALGKVMYKKNYPIPIRTLLYCKLLTIPTRQVLGGNILNKDLDIDVVYKLKKYIPDELLLEVKG